jgi:hypothetical protein
MRDEVQDTEGKAEIGDLVGALGIERQSVCKPRRGNPVDDLSEDLLEVVGELRARLVRVEPLPSQVPEFRCVPRPVKDTRPDDTLADVKSNCSHEWSLPIPCLRRAIRWPMPCAVTGVGLFLASSDRPAAAGCIARARCGDLLAIAVSEGPPQRAAD